MSLITIDLTNLMRGSVHQACLDEFQQQMNQTDGEWVVMPHTHFQTFNIYQPETLEELAVLQFFVDCLCPISLLRFGNALSSRSSGTKTILSEDLAIRYLLVAVESLCNHERNPNSPPTIKHFLKSKELLEHCLLLNSYFTDRHSQYICPEIIHFVEKRVPDCGVFGWEH